MDSREREIFERTEEAKASAINNFSLVSGCLIRRYVIDGFIAIAWVLDGLRWGSTRFAGSVHGVVVHITA